MSKSALAVLSATTVSIEQANARRRQLRRDLLRQALPIAQEMARYLRISEPHDEDSRWKHSEIQLENLRLDDEHVYLGHYDSYYDEWTDSEFMDSEQRTEDSWRACFPLFWLEDDSWRPELIASRERRRQERLAARRARLRAEEQCAWSSYLHFKKRFEGEASVAALPTLSPNLLKGGERYV